MADALDRSREAILLERLHAKTLARGLPWVRAEHEGRYQVRLGEYLIEVGDGAGGAPELLICDAGGKAIEILTPELLGEPGEGGALSRQQMFLETHEGARRLALGVDQVVESLIKALV